MTPKPHSWTCPVKALVLGAAAVALGIYLRVDQLVAQVLVDDEWHAVHQIIRSTPGRMLLDLGYSDYSIPLGILGWYEARLVGLSELALRWPSLLAGILTLLLFPLYVSRHFGPRIAVWFAALLAISPLLVIYSRLARPYAITVLLGWMAHAAYVRYATGPRRFLPGAAYCTCAALATWLHPVIAPFVMAPIAWSLWSARNLTDAARRMAIDLALRIALVTVALIAVLLLPPILTHPEALTLKSGADVPSLATLSGALYAFFGTGSTAIALLSGLFCLIGAPAALRRSEVARSGSLGVGLIVIALLVTRPDWSQMPATFARYLLPAIPLFLLFLASGLLELGKVFDPRFPGIGKLSNVAVPLSLVAALSLSSPLNGALRFPNGYTLHFIHYADFRPTENPYIPRLASFPISPFWSKLAANPAGSIRSAVAPAYFESFNSGAPTWERLSRQSFIPGFLTGLCLDRRWGEVPRESKYAFRNAVHLADIATRDAPIAYVVWQKPFLGANGGPTDLTPTEWEKCDIAIRARFGTPEYEDSHLAAFRVSQALAD